MARYFVFALLAASLVTVSGCGVKREPRALISPSFSAVQADPASANREAIATAQQR